MSLNAHIRSARTQTLNDVTHLLDIMRRDRVNDSYSERGERYIIDNFVTIRNIARRFEPVFRILRNNLGIPTWGQPIRDCIMIVRSNLQTAMDALPIETTPLRLQQRIVGGIASHLQSLMWRAGLDWDPQPLPAHPPGSDTEDDDVYRPSPPKRPRTETDPHYIPTSPQRTN